MPSTEPAPGFGLRAAVGTQLDAIGRGLYGVACSGGMDSMALADCTIACAGAANVVVVTIDHGLCAGSAAVADQVASWARGRGAAAVVRRIEVAREGSLEAAARSARYAALSQIADEVGLAAVLLAHTARDQAETVLMRILRGTGPAGLVAMPRRRGRFVRPFLARPRAAIEAYVAAHQLPSWHDPMNDDLRLTRVRIRERLLPVLREENPAIDDALLRLAASAREWTEVIDEQAAPFAQLPIDCAALARQPAAVRKRALALALEAAGLGYRASHVDALDALVAAPARGQVSLDLPGARVVRTYDRLNWASDPRPRAATDPRVDSAAEAKLMRAEARGPRSEAPPPEPPLPAGVALRTFQPGDRMRPARLGGRSRKLSDLYIDGKVPRAARSSARVLVRTADQTIIWAEFIGWAFGETPRILLPDLPDPVGRF